MITLILVIYTLFLIILFGYSIHAFILINYYYKFRRSSRPTRKKKRLSEPFPVVTVQLPIYNEKYVVHRLIRSVTELDYPKKCLEIQVLDDSDDETIEIVEKLVRTYQDEGYDIKHIRRGSREGFKAGALQFGLNMARGEFIAIFDADFVPPKDFLIELLPEFDSENVGGVQARWGHLNDSSSFLTRAQAIGLDNHFAMEQRLRSLANCFINFNGTCGIWRRTAIIDGGGWQSDTLAEDLDLSYRVQLKGWKIKYREDFPVEGELPENVASFRIQQNRWAMGTIQVARKLLPKVLRSDLRPVAKFEAFVHLTCHINFLAMLGLAIFSPIIVYLKVEGLAPLGYYIFASFFTIGAFGYPFLYYLSQRELYRDYRRRIPFIAGVIAYSMGLSVSNTKAIIEGWLKRHHFFTRTPKSGGKKQGYRPECKLFIPLLELFLGVYMLVGLVYVIATLQLILIPFLLFYCYGFLNLGIFSLKDMIFIPKIKEVVCSRGNF